MAQPAILVDFPRSAARASSVVRSTSLPTWPLRLFIYLIIFFFFSIFFPSKLDLFARRVCATPDGRGDRWEIGDGRKVRGDVMFTVSKS